MNCTYLSMASNWNYLVNKRINFSDKNVTGIIMIKNGIPNAKKIFNLKKLILSQYFQNMCFFPK